MGHEVDALDYALQRAGTNIITLRRIVSGTAVDLQVRAHVRSYRLRDEAFVKGSEQAQDELMVIMSPTEINNSTWPGVNSTGPRYPQRGDFAVIRGRQRAIEVVDPIYIGSDIVRIEMRVLG